MVSSSLFTGLSGLQAHSRFIDVIGNNLANISTPGFWGARATFGDILSFTQSPGSAPNGNFGGQNPMQVGLGVKVGSIDLRTDQGTFQDTGRPMDIALQGKGFFTLSDGAQNFYTRVGTFGVNGDGNLVDVRSGLKVQGTNGNITVPVSGLLPQQATTSIDLQGNLSAKVDGPLTETLQSEIPFKTGTPASKASTLAEPYDLTGFAGATAGTGVPMRIYIGNKSAQEVKFDATMFAGGFTGATAAEIAGQIQSVLGSDVTVTASGGTFTIDTTKLGSEASIRLEEGSSGMLTALGLTPQLISGTETPAIGTTDLGQLVGRTSAYVAGDTIQVSGNKADGEPVSNTFTYGAANDGTTMADLLTFINNNFVTSPTANPDNGSVATLDATGQLTLAANVPGDASMSFRLTDQSGKINLPSFDLSQNGTGPDTHSTTIDVYDSLGNSHPVTMTFTRDAANTAMWDLNASIDASDGTMVAATITGIQFNTDGSLGVPGSGSTSLVFDFSNNAAPGQVVNLNMGTQNSYNGLVMTGDQYSAAAIDQDGFTAGELLAVSFTQAGELTGQYSNGRSQVLETLRLSLFANQNGLLRQGETMFVEAPNSSNPIFTTAGTGGAGVVRSGSLENSNVDIASEFVKLIEAQRGFQANSRVITTTDEILAELINIVR